MDQTKIQSTVSEINGGGFLIQFDKVFQEHTRNEKSRNAQILDLIKQLKESKLLLTTEQSNSFCEALSVICGSIVEGSTSRFLESLIRILLKQSNQLVDSFLKLVIKLGRRSSVAAVPVRRKICVFRW
jgi:hypothetical protein